MADSYAQAGVSIDAGNQAVEMYKESARRATRPEVLGGLGGFGGFFALGSYQEPVLVAGTDGVGTKLKVAFAMDKHDTIGQDLVAMCVNDIVTSGAEPLFFLDYFATGKLSPAQAAQVVDGIAWACSQVGCALLGGETAEMPGFYSPGEYDIAGFAVGAVERRQLIDGSKVQAGNAVIGIPSSGLHSNGYSLARQVLQLEGKAGLDCCLEDLGMPLGDALLLPTRLYVREILALARAGNLLAAAHITGGGLLDNIPRVLPQGIGVTLHAKSWPQLPVFRLIAHRGQIPAGDMYRTFNMGLGMVCIVAQEVALESIAILQSVGCADAVIIGQATEEGGVKIVEG